MKDWIKESLSEKDGTPSTKRQVLAFVVLISAGLAIASFSTGKELTQNVITLLQTLLVAGGGAYTFGRFAETKDTTKEVSDNG